MITYLTARGLSDAQIQPVMRAEKSLEIYQHLMLHTVEQVYQEAVRSISI